MPRKYPKRTRRAPLRLLVALDEDDQIVRYEERRIVVTHEMVGTGEAEDEDGVEDGEEEEEVGEVEQDDDGFVVGEVCESDDDYLPSEDELRTAELEEEADEGNMTESIEELDKESE